MIGFGRCLGFGITRPVMHWSTVRALFCGLFGSLRALAWRVGAWAGLCRVGFGVALCGLVVAFSGVSRAEWGQTDSDRLLGIYRDVQTIRNNMPQQYNELELISVLLGDLHIFQGGNGWLAGIYQNLFSGDGTTFQGQVHSDLSTVISRLNALQTFLVGASGSSSASFKLYETDSSSPDYDFGSRTGTSLTDFLTTSTLNQVLLTHVSNENHALLMNALGFSDDNTLYSMLNDIKGLLGGSSGGGTDLGYPQYMSYWTNLNYSNLFPLLEASRPLRRVTSLAEALYYFSYTAADGDLSLQRGQKAIYQGLNQALLGVSDLGFGTSSAWDGVTFRYDSYADRSSFLKGGAAFRMQASSKDEKVTNILDALRILTEVNVRNGYIASQNAYASANIDFEVYQAVTNLVGALPRYWGSPDDVSKWSQGKFPTVSSNGLIEIEMSPAAGSTAAVTADITPVTTNDFAFLSHLIETNRIGQLDYSAVKDRYVGNIWQMTYSAPTGGAGGGSTVINFGDGMDFDVGDAYAAFKDGVWDTAGPVIKSMFDYLWLACCCISAFIIARKVVAGGV